MSWDDLSKNHMLWPSLPEVTEYRRTVYNLVKNVILTHPDLEKLPITWSDPLWALFMGFEHERIHIETSSVLMREFPTSLLQRPPQWPVHHSAIVFDGVDGGGREVYQAEVANGSNAASAMTKSSSSSSPRNNEWIEVAFTSVVIGKPKDFPSFGWDNEYGSRKFHLQPFKAQSQLVSNAEFLEFVKAGGYRNEHCWTEEGWKWKTFRNAKWPTFWVLDGPSGLHQYRLRLIFETVPMVGSLPVVVNHHEAKAYAAWLSGKDGVVGEAAYRLITEAEHKVLRQSALKCATTNTTTTSFYGNGVHENGNGDHHNAVASDPVMGLTGADFSSSAIHNLNLAYGSECPVNAFLPSPAGFRDVAGNLWQWCEDHIAALPGSYGVHPYYDDFSTPCYDGQHNIMLGGSFISTGDEASTYSRFHFRPHFFQHAGFRLVSGQGRVQTTCADSPPPHVGSWDPSTKDQRKEILAAVADQKLQHEMFAQYACLADGVSLFTSMNGTINNNTYRKEVAKNYSEEIADMVGAAAGFEIQNGNNDKKKTKRAATATNKRKKIDSGSEDGVDNRSALVIGSSVGGISLHLASMVKRVLGVDGDSLAIETATSALTTGQVEVQLRDEGLLSYTFTLQIPKPLDEASVEFKHMDPACLAPDLGTFDVCVVDRVLECSPSPKGLLARMQGPRALLKEGGVLVVASTWEWNVRKSDKQVWLGGYYVDDDGERGKKGGMVMRSKDGLAAALAEEFELVQEREVAYVVKESSRRLNTMMVDVSVWRRKELS